MLVFFFDFLVDTEIPMKCDLLFFSFYIISPKLSSEYKGKVVCTKEDTSLQLHEKKFPFEWSWRQDVKVTHAQRLQIKRVSVWSKSQCIPHTSQA